MSRLDGWRHRLYVLLRGESYSDEIRRELRFHRELEALSQARESLGNETYLREEVRRMTLLSWLDRVRQDARYALRGMRQSPGFAAAVVFTLALGVGVNGAMFSLLSRLFLQPPAGVVRPEEVRRLYSEIVQGSSSTNRTILGDMQYPQYAALRAAVDASTALGIMIPPDSVTIRDGNTRIGTQVSYVNPDYFSVLGVRAAMGRLFATDEGRIDTPTPLAVISDAYWRRSFHGDRGVIGLRVLLSGHALTIIGVTTPGFAGVDANRADMWVLASMFPGRGSYNNEPWYRAFGAGFVVLARPKNAADETRLVTVATSAIRPVRVPGWGYDPNITFMSGPILAALGPGRQSKEMEIATRVAGVVFLVLLITVANVTNLLLLRTARREREIAVRRALGVSRARLFEQIAVESLLLALLGAAVALLIALWAGAALRQLVLPAVRWATSPIDAHTAAFIFGISVVLAFIVGLAPAMHAMRPDLAQSLKAGGRDVGPHGSRLRSSLLALQTALCVVLLVGAGLFIRSLQNVTSIGIGFETTQRVFLSAVLDDPTPFASALSAAIPAAAERLRGMGGVASVAYMDHPPIVAGAFRAVMLPGRDSLPKLAGGAGGPWFASVSPDYFRTMGVRLIAGRDFTPSDGANAPLVTIVSERLAKLYWPGENPLGKCLLIDRREAPCSQVVGVAADVHSDAIIERPTLQIYRAIAQTNDQPRRIVVHIRHGSEGSVLRAADQIVRAMLPELVALQPLWFDDINEREVRSWQLGARLFTALGLLALAVAAVGVYSIVAYSASRRTHEMGVRIALGAERSRILDLVVGDGLRVVLFGIASGIVVSLAAGRVLASLLFGIEPNDPSVLIAASLMLVVVGGVACLLPGWRASRVNPVDALRAD